MSRSYKFNGSEYPSVTTILGILDKPALIAWAANTAVKYCEAHQGEEGVFEKAKKEWREVGAEAMDIGSEIHNLIEKYVKEGKDAVGDLRPEVENGFLAFLEWEKENQISWIESEKNVFSDETGFAGTADAVCFFQAGEFKGRTFLIDFKSSKGFYDGYDQQIAAYRSARMECNGKSVEVVSYTGDEYMVTYPQVDIDGCGVLRLGKEDGMPEFKDYSKKYETSLRSFQALTEYYYCEKKRRLKNNKFVETHYPKRK